MEKTPGQLVYEAFADAMNWIAENGHPMQPWIDVVHTHRGIAWEAAAHALIKEHDNIKEPEKQEKE
jgi:hypothetical protein